MLKIQSNFRRLFHANESFYLIISRGIFKQNHAGTGQSPFVLENDRKKLTNIGNNTHDTTNEQKSNDQSEDSANGDSSVKSVLDLEEIDTNIFRTKTLWHPAGSRGVYGGQVIGQALAAASKTTPDNIHVHSLHSYFLKPGSADRPILYHVENTRDGRNFSSRIVKAVQQGQTILSMMASFHTDEPSSSEHQYHMPDVTDPDKLPGVLEILQSVNKEDLPPNVRKRMERYRSFLAGPEELGVEMKPVDISQLAQIYKMGLNEAMEPRQMFWMKAKHHTDSHGNVHRCTAAFMSDMLLLITSLLPVPEMRLKMMASLDHSMWFHTHFRADHWMLYECESPRMMGNRALGMGRMWRRDGTLAMSVAQEGVVRGTRYESDNKQTE